MDLVGVGGEGIQQKWKGGALVQHRHKKIKLMNLKIFMVNYITQFCVLQGGRASYVETYQITPVLFLTTRDIKKCTLLCCRQKPCRWG